MYILLTKLTGVFTRTLKSTPCGDVDRVCFGLDISTTNIYIEVSSDQLLPSLYSFYFIQILMMNIF